MGADHNVHSAGFDVLADLSGATFEDVVFAGYIDGLKSLAETDAEPAISVVVSRGVDLSRSLLPRNVARWTDGAVAFDSAVQQAANAGRALLVLTKMLLPPREVLAQLIAALDLDQSYGSAQPRFADTAGNVCPLPLGQDEEMGRQPLSCEAVSHLPLLTRVTGLTAACMLLRRDLLRATDAPSPVGTVQTASANRLRQARRLGFCAVIVNGAVVPMTDQVDEYLAVQQRDTDANARLELLLSAAYPAERSDRRLLVDGRGVFDHHDGASRALLGFLDGLAELSPPHFRIEVHSDQSAAEFHGLSRRYPAWRHFHGPIVGPYAAAVAPVAPTSLSTIRDLHRSALAVVALIRDTAAYDMELVPLHHLEESWALLARHANGLSFASDFTRDRFRRRFDRCRDALDDVIHPSLAAGDYVVAECRGLRRSDFVLVFGNDYAYKDLGPTIRTLLDAFPFQRFVVFGTESSPHPRVEWIRNGRATTQTVHGLFATAQAVIYPSFLAGFGFPAIEALAYGADVFVRSSALWPELLESSQLPGRLTEYDSSVALVEALGRLLAEDLSTRSIVEPSMKMVVEVATWRGHASRVVQLIERCLAMDTAARWTDRDHVMGWTRD